MTLDQKHLTSHDFDHVTCGRWDPDGRSGRKTRKIPHAFGSMDGRKNPLQISPDFGWRDWSRQWTLPSYALCFTVQQYRLPNTFFHISCYHLWFPPLLHMPISTPYSAWVAAENPRVQRSCAQNVSPQGWSTAQWLHTWHLCWYPLPCLKPFFHEKTFVLDPLHGWESSEVNQAVASVQPGGLGKWVHHWQVEPCVRHFWICGDRGISATHVAFSFACEISERIYNALWHW